jgi:hypothetical protein
MSARTPFKSDAVLVEQKIARPMSKIFSCCRPIVTAAGRMPADIAIFRRNRRRPAAFSYL